MSPAPTVDELFIADPPSAWAAAGFSVDADSVRGGERAAATRGGGPWPRHRRLVGPDAATLELDGLPTSASENPPAAGAPHPNGVVSIDHLVVITPDIDRTTAVLEGAGFDLRRRREGATPGGSELQSFFRMGEVILELVAAPPGTKIAADPEGPARGGISFLGRRARGTRPPRSASCIGEPRDAVQPGRRIATLRKEAGLGPAIAFMSPGPGAI